MHGQLLKCTETISRSCNGFAGMTYARLINLFAILNCFKGHMNTTWQKTIVFNLINNVRMFWLHFDSLLKTKNTNKVTSPSALKMDIYKQEVTILSLVTWQEGVPLIVNMKSRYHSFKMNIKFLNMCRTCLLIIRTQMCDSFICLERVYSLWKTLLVLCIFLLHTNAQLPVLTLI